MAEEFVDLYEVLNLPLDADRNTIRKRVNELYLEAQRNLDHRDFKTRVRFQELFEVTLPQARYILLDESRRDDYDRMVRAFRAPQGAPGVPPGASPGASDGASDGEPQASSATILGSGSTGGFRVASDSDASLPGASPTLEPLPEATTDPAKLARERDELWQKWKSGLEQVLSDETSDESKRLKPAPRTPRREPAAPVSRAAESTPVAAAPSPAPGTTAPGTTAPAATASRSAAASPAQAPAVNFNFGDTPAAVTPVVARSEAEQALTDQEIEARRADHRRELMKDILIGINFKWTGIGAALVVIPGVAMMIGAMGWLYPRGETSRMPYDIPSIVMWIFFFIIIALGAWALGRTLSKRARRKMVMELSMLSYEEFLRTASRR